MSARGRLFLLSFLFIILVSFLVILSDPFNPITGKPKQNYKPGISRDADRAVNQAVKVYEQKRDLGEDFTNGPCLTNDLLPGWVVDIAHYPRIPIDDLPQNQCQAYREGRAKHFVELDLNGKVIRAI